MALPPRVIAQERRDQIEIDLRLIAADVVPRIRDPLEAEFAPPQGLRLACHFRRDDRAARVIPADQQRRGMDQPRGRTPIPQFP